MECQESLHVKICVSLIIPTPDIFPVRNKRIEYVNREVSTLISDIRHRYPEGSKRLFTLNNNSLSKFLSRGVDRYSQTAILNERGSTKLWLRLKDGVVRCLNNSSSFDSTISVRHHTRRDTHTDTNRSTANNDR